MGKVMNGRMNPIELTPDPSPMDLPVKNAVSEQQVRDVVSTIRFTRLGPHTVRAVFPDYPKIRFEARTEEECRDQAPAHVRWFLERR